MVKDQEYLKKKASFCIDLSKKLGATDVSVTVVNAISETVNFRNKKLDESDRSDSLAISLSTYIGKKKSTISSSNLLEENLKNLIERCIDTTKITPEDQFNSLPDKNLLSQKLKNLNLYDESHISNEKKIEYIKEVEDAAFNEEQIINTESGFSETKSNFILANSDGFLSGHKSSSFSASCVAVSKSDESMERDYEFTNTCHLGDMLKPNEIGLNAAKNAIRKLNPKKLKVKKLTLFLIKEFQKEYLILWQVQFPLHQLQEELLF